MMKMDSVDQKWFDAMKAKGHMPKMKDPDDYDDPTASDCLDTFAFAPDGHNGPECLACGWYACMHCISVDDIPECTTITIDMTSKRLT